MSRQSNSRSETSQIPTGSPLGSRGSRLFDNIGSDLTRKLSGGGWVRKVSAGSCEIQRLSPLAFFEKHKHGNHKYRLLKDGKVVGYFNSKEEIQRALKELTKGEGGDDLQRFCGQVEASDEDRPVHHSGATSRRSLSHNASRSRSHHDPVPEPHEEPQLTRTHTTESHAINRQSKSLSPKSSPNSVPVHENGTAGPWGVPPRPDHGAPAPPAGTKPDYALQSDSDSDREENGRRKKNLRGLSTTDSEAGTQSEASTNHGSSSENILLNKRTSAPPSPKNPKESKPHSPAHQSSSRSSSRPPVPDAISLPRSSSMLSSDDGQAGSPSFTKGLQHGSSPNATPTTSASPHHVPLKRRASQDRLNRDRLPSHDSSLRVRAPSPRAPCEGDSQNASPADTSSRSFPSSSPLKPKETPARHAPSSSTPEHEPADRRPAEKRESRREILVSRKSGVRVDDHAHSPPPVGRSNSTVGTKPTGPGPFVRKLSVGPTSRSSSSAFGRQSSETFGSPGRSVNPSQHVAHKQSSARQAAGKAASDASSPAPRASLHDGRTDGSPQFSRQSSSTLLAPTASIRRPSRGNTRLGTDLNSPTASKNSSPRASQGPSPGNGSHKSTDSSPRVSPRMAPTLEPKKRASKPSPDPEPAESKEPEGVPVPPKPAKPPKPQWTGPELTEAQKPVATKETVVAWYYDDPSNTWTYKELQVRLAEEWFSKGGMRLAYQMVICDPDGTERQFVAKLYNEFAEKEIIAPDNTMFGSEDPERIVGKNWALRTLRRQAGCEFEAMLMQICCPEGSLFSLRDFLTWHRRLKLFKIDVEMQGFCQTYAAEFNKRNPPKPVVFLDAFLIVCINRPKQPIFACEPMILGEFIKHNNNCGQVQERSMERNTPQAFSHFTYWFSRNQYIIVDIQGVGDTYTDPQVHSADRSGFGMGNLGQEGIESFFRTHRCNNICSGLGLVPPHKKEDESGTKYH